MSKQKNEKSVNNSVDKGAVDRSARNANESASVAPDSKPEKSELDGYNPPPRKRKD